MIDSSSKDQRKLERARQKIRILEEMVENRTRELYLKNQKLEQKNEELERFAYVSSHDLQEPIRSIVGFSQLLHRKYRDQFDEEGEEFLEYITEASFRVKNLVNALLDFTRLGKERIVRQVDCNKIIQSIMENGGRKVIDENNITFTCDQLPVVRGCELELGQLFQNVIQNAIKYRKTEEDAEPFVKVRHVETEKEWMFSVEDNGIGFDEEFKDRIFIIFQRLHTRDKYQGTGIGLAMCKKITEMHGGRIWASSKPGEGSTFYFTLAKED